MTSASFTFNPGLYPKLRYDSLKDFAAVSQVVKVPHVILVLPSFPAKTLQDLVRIARAKPGEVLYASSGPGSALHLAGALFAIQTKTQLTHIPYKGGPAAATAVMSGEATVSFSTIETVMSLIQAKRLRALAVSTRERSPARAGCADRDGSGIQGLRSDRLVRPAGAGGHAACRHRHIERRNRALDGDTGGARTRGAGRRNAGRQQARRVRALPARAKSPSGRRIIQQAGIKLE